VSRYRVFPSAPPSQVLDLARSAAGNKKPFSGDLGLTGQHRAETNDDYKPPLKGSDYLVSAKRRDVTSDLQIVTDSNTIQIRITPHFVGE